MTFDTSQFLRDPQLTGNGRRVGICATLPKIVVFYLSALACEIIAGTSIVG
jgi:hypothetical protein